MGSCSHHMITSSVTTQIRLQSKQLLGTRYEWTLNAITTSNLAHLANLDNWANCHVWFQPWISLSVLSWWSKLLTSHRLAVFIPFKNFDGRHSARCLTPGILFLGSRKCDPQNKHQQAQLSNVNTVSWNDNNQLLLSYLKIVITAPLNSQQLWDEMRSVNWVSGGGIAGKCLPVSSRSDDDMWQSLFWNRQPIKFLSPYENPRIKYSPDLWFLR